MKDAPEAFGPAHAADDRPADDRPADDRAADDRPADDKVVRRADRPGPPPDAPARRRASVDLMVGRCLDPAMGVCLRAFDREGRDAARWRQESREVVSRALRLSARKRLAADDRAVHDVMRRVSEIGLDRLIGHPGSVPLPAGVDLGLLLTSGITAEQVAPGGRLGLAELQDAMAASRSSDREVAFVVLAAGLEPDDAATLLGRGVDDVSASLGRAGRRLSEGHAGVPAGGRGEGGRGGVGDRVAP